MTSPWTSAGNLHVQVMINLDGAAWREWLFILTLAEVLMHKAEIQSHTFSALAH